MKPNARHCNGSMQCQHMSEFEQGRIVSHQETCSSYCDILAYLGRAAKIVVHVWNQWIDEGFMQRRGYFTM